MSNKETVNDDELIEFSWKGRTARRIYPEVQAYLSQYRQAEFEYSEAVQAASTERYAAERRAYHMAEMEGRSFDRYSSEKDREAQRAWRAADQAANAEALRVRDAVLDPLKEALMNSPHPEVKFIAENCLFHGEGSEVENYARDILAILPAPTEEIWEEAKQSRGMCDVFDRFYEQAEAAGVFTGGKAVPGYKEIAAFRNFVRRNYGASNLRDVQPHIDRITKAVAADYTAKLEAAKAEWQGLDEAWRSERSRRAAATRAARASGAEVPAERTAEQEAQRLERSVISTQSVTGETIRAEYDKNGPVHTEAAERRSHLSLAADNA